MFADPIRLSYVGAGSVALAGLVWPFPGSIFIATAILAAGQLWASRESAYWFRAVFFLLLGAGLTALQGVDGMTQLPFSADVPLVVGLIASALLFLFGADKKKASRIALVCLLAGVFFSALDGNGTSAYWRGAIMAKKAAGGLPAVSWSDTVREVFGARTGYANIDAERWAPIVDSKEGPLGPIELYRTGLGDMWAPAVNHESVALVAQEMTDLNEYEFHDQRIEPGDVVIDCGGHVGFYTKLALSRGASLVVALEPDPENHWLFSQNLEKEIAEGRVRLIKAGVWDEKGELVFHHDVENPGAHSFFGRGGKETLIENVPVLPLDDLVEELGLERVDWIKMDIEGAEQRALMGAARTLGRFKPNLAICTYHREDDPESIPPIVLAGNSAYAVSAKRIAAGGFIRPKVLFFH
jgi:FkbM family methyltransferase